MIELRPDDSSTWAALTYAACLPHCNHSLASCVGRRWPVRQSEEAYGLPSPAVGELIVEIRHPTKIYKSKPRVVAVDGADLELGQGGLSIGLTGR